MASAVDKVASIISPLPIPPHYFEGNSSKCLGCKVSQPELILGHLKIKYCFPGDRHNQTADVLLVLCALKEKQSLIMYF